MASTESSVAAQKTIRASNGSKYALIVRGLVGQEHASAPIVIQVRDGVIDSIDNWRGEEHGKQMQHHGFTILEHSECLAMPGLIDAHVHLRGETSKDPYRRYLIPSTCERTIRASLDAKTYLESGFTTIRSLGHAESEIVYGVRSCVEQGIIEGPRILTSGWAISQSGGHGNVKVWPYEWVEKARPRSMFADGVVECRKAARLNFGEGADLIKVYTTEGTLESPTRHTPNFTVEEVSAVVDEASRRGAVVSAHATGSAGSKIAILAGVKTLEHGPRAPDREIFEMMADRGVYLVPTLSVMYHAIQAADERGYTQKAKNRLVAEFEGAMEAISVAVDCGVEIMCGTDGGSGVRLGEPAKELELLMSAGLDAKQVLMSATATAAEGMGLGRVTGSIEVGRLADIVILDSDPLVSIRALQEGATIRRVMFNPSRSEPDRA